MPRWGGYTVNLIHYEDAAGITMSVSRRGNQLVWWGACGRKGGTFGMDTFTRGLQGMWRAVQGGTQNRKRNGVLINPSQGLEGKP